MEGSNFTDVSFEIHEVEMIWFCFLIPVKSGWRRNRGEKSFFISHHDFKRYGETLHILISMLCIEVSHSEKNVISVYKSLSIR